MNDKESIIDSLAILATMIVFCYFIYLIITSLFTALFIRSGIVCIDGRDTLTSNQTVEFICERYEFKTYNIFSKQKK